MVVTETSADYNHDSKVDAADYVVWRNTNINGQQGYINWRAQFGNDLSGAGTGANVPEPSSLLLCFLAGVFLHFHRGGRCVAPRSEEKSG